MLTPPDVVSMLMLLVPLYGLYEFAILAIRITHWRAARKAAAVRLVRRYAEGPQTKEGPEAPPGGGGLAVPGPFKRIARAGGQKVTIRTAQRPFFARVPSFRETFFRCSRNDAAWRHSRRKYRHINAVAAELALEGRAQLLGQAADDPLELDFFGLVLVVRDQHRAAERQPGGQLAGPPERDLDRVRRAVEHREFDDLGDEEGDRDGDVLGGVDACRARARCVSLARRLGRAGAQARRQARTAAAAARSRGFSSISAKWLRWTIDKRADPAADRGIGGARLGRRRRCGRGC